MKKLFLKDQTIASLVGCKFTKHTFVWMINSFLVHVIRPPEEVHQKANKSAQHYFLCNLKNVFSYKEAALVALMSVCPCVCPSANSEGS